MIKCELDQILDAKRDGVIVYRYYCRCGQYGSVRRTIQDAKDAWEAHYAGTST